MPFIHRRSWSMLAGLALLLSLLPVTGLSATDHTEVLYSWSEITEGVAVDAEGNIFVSHSPAGELWKIAPGAAGPEVFATVPGLDPNLDTGLIGIAVGPGGDIFGAVVSNNPDANGVWRFRSSDGAVDRIGGTSQITFPNDVAFDMRDEVYITDTALGAVWKVSRAGGTQLWVQSDLMVGTGALGIGPIGANGIAIGRRTVYVAVTEQASIVAIPIRPDGTAGTPYIHAQDDALFAIDGIKLAINGDIYAAVIGQFAVARVGRDGSVDVVASAANGDAGVLDVSSIAFGTVGDSRRSLFGVNFGFLSQGDFGDAPRPALVEVRVGVRGAPLP